MRIVLSLLLTLAFACPSSESSDGSDEETSGTEDEIVLDTGDDPPEGTLNVGEDACQSDADCVKASCCHAAACVHRDNAPDCSETMCTADCQFGTTDCGGGCLCHEGRCAARLSEAPDIAAPQ